MCAAIAQLVEQGTENPCVLGSIPSCGTIFVLNNGYTLHTPNSENKLEP